MYTKEIQRRRTFAIISHPDAGKTTLTEKLLFESGRINKAGTVKARGSGEYAKSDWMEMEKQRGISITTSVMQFEYNEHIINLLDTPGHSDFSEDTYRTLTAVDTALMVIDGSKGVEERTVALMKVTRMRNTPVISFINKLDRDIRDPIELLDEIEKVLKIKAAPITWPIGSYKDFKGSYDLTSDIIHVYQKHAPEFPATINSINSNEARALLGFLYDDFLESLDLIQSAGHRFNHQEFLDGNLTPIYFGTALGGFGINHILDCLVDYAPKPKTHNANNRIVDSYEQIFSGFVFKIQANMDPKHRDRIAFMRICSGKYERGIRLIQTRTSKEIKLNDALTFFSNEREHLDTAYAGDIIGIHNHGTIQIGDTFTQGELLMFTGIPNFAPEIFKKVILKDPLKSKSLRKGLQELSEEGAVQVFFPKKNNDIILGAIGILQFDVVASRLKEEYKVELIYEPVSLWSIRWIDGDNKAIQELENKSFDNLAIDGGGFLVYLAPTRVNLQLTTERHTGIKFTETRESQY